MSKPHPDLPENYVRILTPCKGEPTDIIDYCPDAGYSPLDMKPRTSGWCADKKYMEYCIKNGDHVYRFQQPANPSAPPTVTPEHTPTP